jgi:hypothetical protein
MSDRVKSTKPYPRILRLTAAMLAASASLEVPARACAAEVYNLTGLPAYPNLNTAKMDEVSKTDKLGRWCNRFAGSSSDPLDVVEAWYRKVLWGASETDLNNDENYASAVNLYGIKLALGIDYVTVFRLANQPFTSIELFRCSAPK